MCLFSEPRDSVRKTLRIGNDGSVGQTMRCPAVVEVDVVVAVAGQVEAKKIVHHKQHVGLVDVFALVVVPRVVALHRQTTETIVESNTRAKKKRQKKQPHLQFSFPISCNRH